MRNEFYSPSYASEPLTAVTWRSPHLACPTEWDHWGRALPSDSSQSPEPLVQRSASTPALTQDCHSTRTTAVVSRQSPSWTVAAASEADRHWSPTLAFIAGVGVREKKTRRAAGM